MERCGRYCQGEKAVRDNTKVFVLSNWLENSSHILLLGTLEEEQIAGKAGTDNHKEKENLPSTPSLRLHWQGEDSPPD